MDLILLKLNFSRKLFWDATEQGRYYISTLREMVNKTRELADARTTLNVERSATLAGSVTESEEIKRQGEINREKLRIERSINLSYKRSKIPTLAKQHPIHCGL